MPNHRSDYQAPLDSRSRSKRISKTGLRDTEKSRSRSRGSSSISHKPLTSSSSKDFKPFKASNQARSSDSRKVLSDNPSPSGSNGPPHYTDYNCNLVKSQQRRPVLQERESLISATGRYGTSNSRRTTEGRLREQSHRSIEDADLDAITVTKSRSNLRLRNKNSSSREYGFRLDSRNSKGSPKKSKHDFFEAPEEIETPTDESLRSSMEGTPVILSREGSRIRIIDEETGEVFFKKRSKSRPRNSTSKESIFVPRQSSCHVIETINPYSVLKHLDNRPVTTKAAPSASAIMSGHSEANLDDVGDIVVPSGAFTPPTPRGRSSVVSPIRNAPTQGILKKPQPQIVYASNVNERSKTPEIKSSSNRIHKTKDPVTSDLEKSTTRSRSKSEKAHKEEVPPEEYLGRRSRDRIHSENSTKERSKSKSPEIKPPNELKKKPSVQFSPSTKSGQSQPKSDEDEKPHSKPYHRKSSRSHRSRSRGSASGKNSTIMIPGEVFQHVFDYLCREDLETCSRVCARWKRLTDLRLRGPLVFKGRSPYGNYYSSGHCIQFVTYLQKLEAAHYRPVEMRFHHASGNQMRTLCDKLGKDFRPSIRHMESFSLINCSFKWKTLMLLLQSFSRSLRILFDINSDYYSQHGLLVCEKYRQKQNKETSRKEFQEFKDQLKYLRRLSITRKTVTHELTLFLKVLSRGTRNLEELEINLGPWETPTNSNTDAEFCNVLSYYVKELKGLMNKNRDTLKKIKFSWSDRNFTGYFSTCIDALNHMRLNYLREITLEFDKHAMKGKNVSLLRDFLEYHYSRSLRQFKISKMLLGEDWAVTSNFFDALKIVPISNACFDFKIVISDHCGPPKLSSIHKILQLETFRCFTSDIHFCIENENTKSISQMFGKEWHRKCQYPRVKSVLISFQPEPMKSYDNFTNFNIDLIVKCFPNLTQLKISDRLAEHNQIFTRVVGRRLKVRVSKSALDNRDFQLISGSLVKLKVIRLWVDMTHVDDHGITGIHRGDISVLHEENIHYSWDNFGNDVVPNFSNLKFLEELSLHGLGHAVTDISAKFGFQNLERLKLLELWGRMAMTKDGRRTLRKNCRENGNGTIVKIKRCMA